MTREFQEVYDRLETSLEKVNRNYDNDSASEICQSVNKHDRNRKFLFLDVILDLLVGGGAGQEEDGDE